MLRQLTLLAALLSLFSFAGTAEAQNARVRPYRIPAAKCNESTFKPCICPGKVPKTIQYRPSIKACDGRAGAILSGSYASSYSIVLRDRLNRDRFPSEGFQGCSLAEANLGLARCSAYKVQKKIRKGKSVIHCFGAAGTDRVLEKATRMTIKLKDIPGSNLDPLVRICLNDFSALENLN